MQHPNLALIYSVERWRDVPLLVVEYLDGGTLADSLQSRPMEVDDVLELGIVLADVLDRMHAGGVLHRDIKPSNIGYSEEGVVKLLDFGLAAMLDRVNGHHPLDPRELVSVLGAVPPAATASLSHQVLGTPLYLSPQAIAGQEPDQSFDLWALGLVLYEALAGRHPLGGYPTVEAMRRIRSVRLPDVRDFRRDCPPALAAFLNDALALASERRPETAADFRVHLQLIRQAHAAESQRTTRAPLY
ncbi:MAG: serine/threonine-protein kinase [Vicinamibacterales bacterium]